MSENRMLLDEIRDLKRRLQALETRGEHPGFAASDVARLSQDNTFTGVVNTFDNDVDIDGDLAVGGDATITGTVQAAAAWIPGVAVSLNAKLYCGFNGNEPYETTYTGSSTGHRGQTGTETGGVIYRPGKFGKGVQVAETTTNLITNPSCETGTTGWGQLSTSGGCTVSVAQSTDTLYGSYSGQVTFSFGGSGSATFAPVVYPHLSVSASTAYTFSLRYKVSSASSGAAAALYFVTWQTGYTNQSTASSTALDMTVDGEWRTVSGTITTGSGHIFLSPRINFSVANSVILIDGVQVEQKAYATPYCDGSLGTGHSWSGTAHASTSSRTAASLSYATSSIVETVGTVMSWVYRISDRAAASRLMRVSGTTAGHIIVSIRRSSDDRAGAHWGTVEVAGSAVPIGEWHHLAITYDGTTLRLYQNGVLTGSGTPSGFSGMPALFYVGSFVGGSEFANSFIDDFAILPRAASGDEIRAIYESQAQLICS